MQHFVCSLGKIPLRQLVYRVIELPPSMRPLVYDFGQLTNSTEQDYTGQIVINHCSEILSQQVITAVSLVLAWCQKFMREKEVSYIILYVCSLIVVQDECSFVSLRDVERAMIVFKFFIDKMSLFKDLIADKAKDEVRNLVMFSVSPYNFSFFSTFKGQQDSSARSPHMGFSTCSQYLLSCSTTGQRWF